jgi:integrase
VSASGGALDDGDVRDGFYAALVRAGLGHKRHQDPPLRFHDLRHTFGTLAVQVWPLVDVQAYMGHRDVKTTMRYAHHQPKHDAAERFSRFVSAQSVSPLCPELATSTPTERNSAQLNGA